MNAAEHDREFVREVEQILEVALRNAAARWQLNSAAITVEPNQ